MKVQRLPSNMNVNSENTEDMIGSELEELKKRFNTIENATSVVTDPEAAQAAYDAYMTHQGSDENISQYLLDLHSRSLKSNLNRGKNDNEYVRLRDMGAMFNIDQPRLHSINYATPQNRLAKKASQLQIDGFSPAHRDNISPPNKLSGRVYLQPVMTGETAQ